MSLTYIFGKGLFFLFSRFWKFPTFDNFFPIQKTLEEQQVINKFLMQDFFQVLFSRFKKFFSVKKIQTLNLFLQYLELLQLLNADPSVK